MINVSLSLESVANIETSAAFQKVGRQEATALMLSLPADVDPQERRWQLEWDRRNVED